jgi:hypothetical protein
MHTSAATDRNFVSGMLRYHTRATEFSICNLSSFTTGIIRGFYRGTGEAGPVILDPAK